MVESTGLPWTVAEGTWLGVAHMASPTATSAVFGFVGLVGPRRASTAP